MLGSIVHFTLEEDFPEQKRALIHTTSTSKQWSQDKKASGTSHVAGTTVEQVTYSTIFTRNGISTHAKGDTLR
jgi:hypothetical protein